MLPFVSLLRSSKRRPLKEDDEYSQPKFGMRGGGSGRSKIASKEFSRDRVRTLVREGYCCCEENDEDIVDPTGTGCWLDGRVG